MALHQNYTMALMTKPRTNRKAKSYAYLWQQYTCRSHKKTLLHCLIPYITCAYFNTLDIFYTALLWQREASDKSDISCNFKNKMCHFTDINGISWCLTQHLLMAGRVLRHKIWQYKTSITQIDMVRHLRFLLPKYSIHVPGQNNDLIHTFASVDTFSNDTPPPLMFCSCYDRCYCMNKSGFLQSKIKTGFDSRTSIQVNR